MAHAVNITDYASPLPPQGTGPHRYVTKIDSGADPGLNGLLRYVIILYTQPPTFSPPSDLSQPNTAVGLLNLTQYVADSKLGSIVAVCFILPIKHLVP